MAEVADWFNQIPPITRYWFAASIAVPALGELRIFSPYTLILTSDFLKNLQLWKPLTAALYHPISFHLLINLYFIYNYSQRLEVGHFNGRPADYTFMLIFNWLNLVVISLTLGVMSMVNPMIMSVIYVYCMLNRDQIVNFWFGTRFKARYLPWALFGANYVINGGGMSDILGIIVGHLYYFVMIKYPADQGVTLLRTPQILYNFLPSNPAASYVNPDRTSRAPFSQPQPTAPNTTTSTGYNWGRGRRLED